MDDWMPTFAGMIAQTRMLDDLMPTLADRTQDVRLVISRARWTDFLSFRRHLVIFQIPIPIAERRRRCTSRFRRMLHTNRRGDKFTLARRSALALGRHRFRRRFGSFVPSTRVEARSLTRPALPPASSPSLLPGPRCFRLSGSCPLLSGPQDSRVSGNVPLLPGVGIWPSNSILAVLAGFVLTSLGRNVVAAKLGVGWAARAGLGIGPPCGRVGDYALRCSSPLPKC